MVLADSHRISPVPWYSGTSLGQLSYTYRAFTFYGAAFQAASISTRGPVCEPYNPGATEITPVWAVPRSLATTWGITIVFSSSGYLDVSVRRVRFHVPMCSARDDRSSTCRVAPFGNPRINACLQLPVAYRSLPRPSSPVHAKASTMRPYLLMSAHVHEPDTPSVK
jgi:hypothetical protein